MGKGCHLYIWNGNIEKNNLFSKLRPKEDQTASCVHNFEKAFDWILSYMQSNERLTTPNPNPEARGCDENICSEIVYLYCLSPIREAGKIFNNLEYEKS